MKILLFLLTFATLCPLKLLCQRGNDIKPVGRQPLPNTLRLTTKQKELWKDKGFYFSANFQQSRNLSGVSGQDMVCRTSSYSLPLLIGRQLREKWSIEAGPFIGVNRESFQRTSMLQSEAPRLSTVSPAYGFLFGVSRQLVDRLSLQLRVRQDFGNTRQAWEPIQLGWNLRF